MAMSAAPRDIPKAHPIPPPGPMGCWRDKGLGCPLFHHITALGQSPQPLKGYAGCRAQPGAVLGLREARPGSEMINHLGSGWLTPGSREKPGLRAPGAAEGAGQGPPIRPPLPPQPTNVQLVTRMRFPFAARGVLSPAKQLEPRVS